MDNNVSAYWPCCEFIVFFLLHWINLFKSKLLTWTHLIFVLNSSDYDTDIILAIYVRLSRILVIFSFYTNLTY